MRTKILYKFLISIARIDIINIVDYSMLWNVPVTYSFDMVTGINKDIVVYSFLKEEG